ncbi:general secretion pathway protein GspH [Vibrio caribbeanicus]|uniref:General secretion pathway protein GspH n=1 Tax=Vibrio caribbeanicus TaxID=701175 RepID=A0ACC4NSE1_9VIBR|nr:type II secretion system minor pseudopilin GspH [Vibrio caribbeanicus]KHD23412.1 general secretion pathway protein GspH [Vibrio caribbeanicus]
MLSRKGFTLIEILLVLVLLSVASVAVISTLPQKSSDEAKSQALSLYHRLQLLNEEAILSGRDYGVRFDEKRSSYLLMALESGGWKKLDDEQIPEQAQLPDSLAMLLELGGNSWKDEDRLFKPGSLFDEEMFADVEEEKKLKPPQVFIMSSGEVTPFSIAIYPQERSVEKDAWRVVAKENGQIIVLAPGESDEEEQ